MKNTIRELKSGFLSLSVVVLSTAALSSLALSTVGLSAVALSSDVMAAKRIVGGAVIDISTAPYQAAVGLAGVDTFNGQFCGGTIIDEKWILTAAHCFLEGSGENLSIAETGRFVITVGETTLSTASSANQYTFTMQDNVYMHPGFALDKPLDNDIALIQLPSAINLEGCGSNCSAIEFATPDNEATLAPLSTQAWSSGWGAITRKVPVLINGELQDPINHQSFFSDALKEVELRIVACGDSLTGIARTERVICAGAIDMNQEDTCQGDSGGPLVVRNNAGTGFALVGVNSYGHGCAAGEEGAYTRVSKFNDWITTRLSNPTVTPSQVGDEDAGSDSNNVGDTDVSSNTAALKSDGGGSAGFLMLFSLALLAMFRRANP